MHLLALILAIAPLISASIGDVFVGPRPQKTSSLSQTFSATSTSSPSATSAPTPAVNCTNVSTSIDPSCWDALEMNDWTFNWNFTNKTCNKTETWSNCFLREAFGTFRNDCSKLGSVSCPAPILGTPPYEAHVWYGVYNIYGERCGPLSKNDRH